MAYVLTFFTQTPFPHFPGSLGHWHHGRRNRPRDMVPGRLLFYRFHSRNPCGLLSLARQTLMDFCLPADAVSCRKRSGAEPPAAAGPAATRRMQVKFFRPAGQRAPRGSTAWLTATCQAHRREPQNRPPGRAERAVWRCKHCRLAPPNGGLRHAQAPGVMLFHGRCRRQPRRQAAARLHRQFAKFCTQCLLLRPKMLTFA